MNKSTKGRVPSRARGKRRRSISELEALMKAGMIEKQSDDYRTVMRHRSSFQFLLRLSKSKDADVIGRLRAQPNGSAYLKKLVREDMAKKGRR